MCSDEMLKSIPVGENQAAADAGDVQFPMTSMCARRGAVHSRGDHTLIAGISLDPWAFADHQPPAYPGLAEAPRISYPGQGQRS